MTLGLADSARVSITLADYAAMGEMGKTNVLGAGIGVSPLLPTGATSPLTVWAHINFAPEFDGEQVAVGICLKNAVGEVVSIATNLAGQTQDLRVQQLATLEAVKGAYGSTHHVIPKSVRPTVNLLLRFDNGLPIPAGNYDWEVEIDGNTREAWKAPLYVAAPNPPPVIG